MNARNKCCVIIVTFNGAEWIEKCIFSLLDSSFKVDIVIVDNGSTDGTKDFVRKFQNIKLIENDENLGFGKANNLGLKYAYHEGYAYFFLLNQDAWVQEDTIQHLINAQLENTEYGILSPIHLNGTGQHLDEGFERYMRLRKSSGFYHDFSQGSVKESIYEVSFVNAAAWMISKLCLEEVGGFHPLFDHYGEDDNYIHRVRERQLKIGVLGSAKIHHDREVRFRRRINPKTKFRSMVIMTYLNPKRDSKGFFLWLISMMNLVTIPFSQSRMPDFTFYFWGIVNYSRIIKEIKAFDKNKYSFEV